MSFDSRGEEQFREEVEEYVEDPEQLWRALSTEGAIDEDLAVLRLAVMNPTERNFEGVQVEVILPPDVLGTLKASEVRPALDVPDTPLMWGKHSVITAATRDLERVQPVLGPKHVVDQGNVTRIRFDAGHVRPGTPATRPDVHLLIPAPLAGEQLSVHWRITSTSVDSWQEGEITLDVDPQPVVLVPRGERP